MNKRYILGAIIAAVVVVGVLVGLSLAGGDDDPTVSTITGVEQMKTELKGIEASGTTIGAADAPIQIVEYGDTSCPICKDAAEGSVPELITQYVRTGKASLAFRPVAFISPSSERGALGAEAAAMQDKMWPFISLVYANQGAEAKDWLTDDLLRAIVAKAGLDVDRWQKDYDSEAVASAFFASDAAWKADGGTGTPTFVVTGPRGKRVFAGNVELAKFEEAIAAVGPAL